MFNIGFAELILILLVAFVIVGPRDLPKIAAALGRGVRTIKQFMREFQDETGLGEVVDEFKRTSRDIEKTIREADPLFWQSLIYFLSLQICLFWTFYINRAVQYAAFLTGFFHLA